jgi:hypothetical protein
LSGAELAQAPVSVFGFNNSILQNYPDDDGRMAYHARYSYYAEQCKKLHELLPKVKLDYYCLFGGTGAFNQIVQSTKANVSQQ